MTRRELAAWALLWTLIATAVATGVLAGSVLATTVRAADPTPRTAEHADPPHPSGGKTTERTVSLPSPDMLGGPGSRTITPAPHRLGVMSVSDGASPSPRARGPVAATGRPAAASPPRAITGVATWFRSPAGVSAAGPDLRAALGPGWRGTSVRVCADRCITTVLGDWMRADRLIDLHAPLFARLAPLWKGVLRVEVTR